MKLNQFFQNISKGHSRQASRAEVELSVLQQPTTNSTRTKTLGRTTIKNSPPSTTTLGTSPSIPAPLDLDTHSQPLQTIQPSPLLISDFEDVFGPTTESPIYNSLSTLNTNAKESPSGMPLRQCGPFEVLNEDSPLRGDPDELFFRPQEYRRYRKALRWVLLIGGGALSLMVGFGIAYVFLHSSSASSNSINRNSNSTMYTSVPSLEGSSNNDTNSHEDKEWNTKIISSKVEPLHDPKNESVQSFVSLPIPDLRTRSEMEFIAKIQNPSSLIMSDMNASSLSSHSGGSGNSQFQSFFTLPPTANSTVVSEGIREGVQALLDRQKTEDRIQKLGFSFLNSSNGTPHSFNQFFGYTTTTTAEEKDIIHKLSLIGFSMERASRVIAKRLNLTKTEAEEGIILDTETKIEPNTWCAAEHGRMLHSACNVTEEEYRSYNGRCNNLNHPQWGSALQPYRRILLPDYADGISIPRKSSEGNHRLPNAKLISTIMFSNRHINDSIVSMLFLMWAEFIEQDMLETVLSSSEENSDGINCCENGKVLEIQHPECFPINMTPEDDFYDKVEKHCLTVVRSAAAPTCTFGPREQFNLNTAFIDASTIYGSLNFLKKTHRGGGINSSSDEELKNHLSKNFIWEKHHVIISNQLRTVNPHWDDNRLFEETKRIVVAEIQHITFNEYLLLLLGSDWIKAAGIQILESGYYEGYDKLINPGISNAVASTVSKFWLSMVHRLSFLIGVGNNTKNYTQLSNLVNPFLKGHLPDLETLIRNFAFNPAGAVDTSFSENITSQRVNGDNSNLESDSAAIVIQRGRDHGIPAYPHWRKLCGLKELHNFSDLQQVWEEHDIKNVQKVYKSLDDIDLLVGGLAELRSEGVALGPTFLCLLADQFSRTRKGDRFWYEGDIQIRPFTLLQLRSIRGVTLANILCEMYESLGAIQGHVFKQISEDNPILPCSKILASGRLNFSAWKEEKPIPAIEIPLRSAAGANIAI